MEDMQSQMNAILGNPEMMRKIMSMAQSLNQSQPTQPPQEQKQDAPSSGFPEIDISMLQKLSGLASQSSIDKNQRSLLSALRPYLSSDRISKLEKAMRAAKMASMASGLLGSAGFQFNPGR